MEFSDRMANHKKKRKKKLAAFYKNLGDVIKKQHIQNHGDAHFKDSFS